MKKEFEIFIFNNKFNRVLSYISCLLVPILLIVLIYNFSVFGMVAIILISIIIIGNCYWCHNYKLILYNDKIILQRFKKYVFELDKIESISIEPYGYINILYNNKNHKISGFIDIFSNYPNEDKNIKLLKKINQNRIRYTKKGIVYNPKPKEIEVLAEKRMWTVFLVLIYFLFDLVLIVSLIIKGWNIVIFWVVFVITIITVPILIIKIGTPKDVLIYDSKNKKIIIRKIFKTIEVDINNIKNYQAAYRGDFILFRTKDKRRIYLHGAKNIGYVSDKLSKIIKCDYSNIFIG